MKTLLRRCLPALLALLCLPAFLVLPAGASLLAPSEDYYIADYAGVLSPETTQTVIGANGALETLTGGQIVVATVNEMDGFAPEEYAARLFDDWAVGNYTEDNGMLLLLAVGEGRACLFRGEGIEDDFDDKTRDALLEEYFWPEFQAGNYDGAVNALFLQLVGWYEGHYGVHILNVGEPREEGSGFARFAVVFSIVVLVILLLVLGILVAIGADKRRYRRYYYGAGVPMPRYRPYFFFFGGPHRPRRYRGGAKGRTESRR